MNAASKRTQCENPKRAQIIHLWLDYAAHLFDRSHPLALSQGFESELLCRYLIDNGAPLVPHTQWIDRIQPQALTGDGLLQRLIRRIKREWADRRFAARVKHRLSASNAALVHIHFGTTAVLLAQHNALPKQPFIVSFYGVDISAALRNKKTCTIYAGILPKAHLLHVLCEEAKQRLVLLGCEPDRIHIANLPIPIAAFSGLPISFNVSPVLRLLMPCRFVIEKGHHIALAALQQLIKSGHSAQLRCFGYGANGWLKAAVSTLQLTEHVRIIDNGLTGDFVSAYQQELMHADIVLAPSLPAPSGDDEGGPALTLVMAQAAAKPVIVSNFPGAERSVTHGIEGLVVPMGDAHALAQAIAKLNQNRGNWAAHGKAGRARAEKDFSDASFAAKLANWYCFAQQN
jgi:colanic acid/amylovoran biosynthesis glycosyltransferase